MARNTEKLIREYSEDFKAIISRDVKRLASKEEQDFLFKNVDMWDSYLASLYAEICTALSINDLDYNIDGESAYNDYDWKKKALYFKLKVQARLAEVKLLSSERHKEKNIKEEKDRHPPTRELLEQILAELKELNRLTRG